MKNTMTAKTPEPGWLNADAQLANALADIETQSQMINGARKAASRLMITNSELMEAIKRINQTSIKETFHGDVDRFQEWLDGFTAELIFKFDK